MIESIEIKNLRKTYKDAVRELVVIDSLSESFPTNKSIAIVGRSGVGKSTLLHLLAGLVQADMGEINFGQIKINELKGDRLSDFRAEHIGFIYQFHHLLPEFTAVENIAMPLFIKGISEQLAIEKAQELLDFVQLSARANHLPSELSGGEQQRVAIARAVVAQPSLVLADEPTGNLDPETATIALKLLLDLRIKSNSTLIVVTHQRDAVSEFDLAYEFLVGGKLTRIK
jgi:lipoprotein-releasing system ATP-binding protein